MNGSSNEGAAINEGAAMRIAKSTVIGALALGVLALFWLGVDAKIQEKAKEAVQDTIGVNSQNIEKLQALVNDNKSKNTDTEKKLGRMEEQLKSLQNSVKDLKDQNLKVNEKLDKLTTLLIEFIQSQK